MATRNTGLKRQRNQRGEGARLKDEVIEAAMRILDRSPTAELTLRTVAKEAGVAAPSLYRQFADVEAMIKDVVRACWDQMGAAILAAGAPLEREPALSRLQAQMAAYVHYAMQTPSRYQLLFALPIDRHVELDSPLRSAFRVVLKSVEDHFAQGGRLPTTDAVSSTLLAISFTHGRIALANLASARPGNASSEVEAFVRSTLAMLFAN